MTYSLNQTGSINRSFEELLELSSVTRSRFKLVGNKNEFIIKTSSDNIGIGTCLLIITAIPSILLYQNINDYYYWICLLLVIAAIYAFFRYYPSTNDIIIDTCNKKLIIKSNNFISRYIIPPVEINFRDFQCFTTKKVSVGQDLKSHYNRVYIKYKDKRIHIMDFLNGPFYYIDHKVFIKALEKIIKNAA